MRNPDICPTHPGELLRENVLPAVGKSKAEVARLLGISRKHLGDILAERRHVTPELAVRLSKLFGSTPKLWIRLQGNHDVWHACREVDVSDMPSLNAAEKIEAWDSTA